MPTATASSKKYTSITDVKNEDRDASKLQSKRDFRLSQNGTKDGTALQTTPDEIDYERLAEAELEAASKATTDLQRHRHLDQAAVYAALSEKSRELPSFLLGQ